MTISVFNVFSHARKIFFSFFNVSFSFFLAWHYFRDLFFFFSSFSFLFFFAWHCFFSFECHFYHILNLRTSAPRGRSASKDPAKGRRKLPNARRERTSTWTRITWTGGNSRNTWIRRLSRRSTSTGLLTSGISTSRRSDLLSVTSKRTCLSTCEFPFFRWSRGGNW